MSRAYGRAGIGLVVLGFTLQVMVTVRASAVPPPQLPDGERAVPAELLNSYSLETQSNAVTTELVPGTVSPSTAISTRRAAASGITTGGDNCHETTPNPVAVPGAVVIPGDNSAATGPDTCAGFNMGTIWWESFTITQCADVQISFCGSTPLIPSNWIFVNAGCSPDGSTCFGLTGASSWDRTSCGDGNITFGFTGLPAGTYYYPIISDSFSNYQMHVTTFECAGACCNPAGQTCTDDVLESNCQGAGEQFFAAETCAGSGCTGACCDQFTGTCLDNVFEVNCSAAYFAGERCCNLECRDQSGPEFDAVGVTMMSNVPLGGFSTSPGSANEVWGYVSDSGREYAIMGLECAFAVIEVTNPFSPSIIAEIPGSCSTWRDTAIYGHFAYGVIDAVSDGMYIMDLTNVDAGVVDTTLVNLPMGGEFFERAHNAIVNPDSGYLYLGIPNTNGGAGLGVIDVGTDPANPAFVGHWTDDTDFVRCHDMHIITYTSGPNAGKEIAFCFGESRGLVIADVTDKGNMFTISKLLYPNTSYGHQGWVDDARNYVYVGDELDERDDPDVDQTTTYVVDISNLNTPTLHTTVLSETCAIDHNLHVKDGSLFESNYASGLRIYDVSDVNNITESGYFDSHPEDNATDFDGTWGNYPFLPSGNILLSDRQRGLFVLDASVAMGTGACCDLGTDTCVNNVLPENCSFMFTEGSTCAEVGCGSCPGSSQPISGLPDTGSGVGNRTLVVETDPADAGQSQAIRVVFSSLDPPYDIWNGEQMWVQAPSLRCENSGQTVPPCTGASFWAAPLDCTPFYTDWSVFGGPMHVHHEGVAPNSLYRIDVIDAACDAGDPTNYSASINVATSGYGDCCGNFDGAQYPPPQGSVDIVADVIAVLAKFSNTPGAPISSRVDFEPIDIDWRINITDVVQAVNGFSGVPYPFGPTVGDPCP